jgi:hypothetical protein
MREPWVNWSLMNKKAKWERTSWGLTILSNGLGVCCKASWVPLTPNSTTLGTRLSTLGLWETLVPTTAGTVCCVSVCACVCVYNVCVLLLGTQDSTAGTFVFLIIQSSLGSLFLYKIKVLLYSSLGSESANFFWKWPDSKYFRVFRPDGLCHNYSVLPL